MRINKILPILLSLFCSTKVFAQPGIGNSKFDSENKVIESGLDKNSKVNSEFKVPSSNSDVDSEDFDILPILAIPVFGGIYYLFFYNSDGEKYNKNETVFFNKVGNEQQFTKKPENHKLKSKNFDYKGISIRIQNIDITEIETDEDEFKTNTPEKTFIVNAANNEIGNGAGVALAIENAAGKKMVSEINKWKEQKGYCIIETGECIKGTAGNMKMGAVWHGVGPNISGGKLKDKDKQLLTSVYFNILQQGNQESFERAVFPSISTGEYKFPIEEAAKCAKKAVDDFLDKNPKPNIKYIEWAFLDIDAGILEKMFGCYSGAWS